MFMICLHVKFHEPSPNDSPSKMDIDFMQLSCFTVCRSYLDKCYTFSEDLLLHIISEPCIKCN